MENRQIHICEKPQIEIRAREKDKYLEGYAAVYNSKTTIRDYTGEYDEMIIPGAFDDALKDPALDVVALFDHEGQPLGRTTSGTLKLSSDNHGLRYSVKLPNTQLGNDVHEMVKRGDINGSSFGFMPEDDGEHWDSSGGEGGRALRTLTKLRLFDVSPVMTPAYKKTTVMARSQQKRSMIVVPNWKQQIEERKKQIATQRKNINYDLL